MKNFTTPWNYANGGGLLVAPINVPRLLSSLLFINFSVAVVLQCSPVYGLEVSNKKYWYGPIPFPPPSFSFTFHFPPLRSPSISLPFLFCPSPSTNQLGGLGEYCNLAQRSLGFSLGRTSIYVIFWAQKTCSMATKLFVCLYIWQSSEKVAVWLEAGQRSVGMPYRPIPCHFEHLTWLVVFCLKWLNCWSADVSVWSKSIPLIRCWSCCRCWESSLPWHEASCTVLYPHCLSIKLAFLFLVTRGEPVKVITQGDHLSGKPGNVREFDSCQGFY